MNAILGAKIKNLRESRGFTQEQLAAKLNCTRQKYARLEKGLLDISYANISIIAQVLDVTAEEITSSVSNIVKQEPIYRKNNGLNYTDKFEYINNMLDTFYAHRKLYYSVKQVDADE